ATACFFAAWAVYACALLARTRSLRHYLLAGLLAGVAIAAKQLTWPLVVTILLCHLFPERDPARAAAGPAPASPARRWLSRLLDGKLLLAALATVVAFLATSPE